MALPEQKLSKPVRRPLALSPIELGAWRGFLRAHAELVRALDAALREKHDLPLAWYDVLVVLEEAPGHRLRMADLSASVILTPSGITRLVDRMTAEGLVRRERCASDRRGYFAVATDEGLARLTEARPTHRSDVRRLFLAAFDPQELASLAAYWRRLPASS
jgi:DNA-binding MarR family transcriptional regulator